jgi:hypothetical protein
MSFTASPMLSPCDATVCLRTFVFFVTSQNHEHLEEPLTDTSSTSLARCTVKTEITLSRTKATFGQIDPQTTLQANFDMSTPSAHTSALKRPACNQGVSCLVIRLFSLPRPVLPADGAHQRLECAPVRVVDRRRAGAQMPGTGSALRQRGAGAEWNAPLLSTHVPPPTVSGRWPTGTAGRARRAKRASCCV